MSFPLLLGITGHRDLPAGAERALAEKFRAFIRRLRQACPHAEFRVFSQLAEGADRLAASVALEEGCCLHVVLPMPLVVYETTFRGDVVPFRDLLARAAAITEIPLAGATQDLLMQDAEARRLQFSHASAWICRQVSLLVAFWDGQMNASGTAEAVGFRLNSIPPELGQTRSLLNATETGPVLHLPVDAEKAACWLSPDDVDEAAFMARCQQVDQLSTRTMSLSGAAGNDPSACVQALGGRFDRARRRLNSGILLLGLLGAVALQLYSSAQGQFPLADVYAVFFFVIGSLYFWGRRRHFNELFVDYLVLAEGLRIQAFWNALGFEARVAEQFSYRHRRKLGWVVDALKFAPLQTPRRDLALRATLAHWLAQNVQQRRAEWLPVQGKATLFERGIYGFYGLSGLLSILAYFQFSPLASDALSGWLAALIGITASCGTLLLIFNGALDYAGKAAMLKDSLHVLEQAEHMLQRDLPPHEIAELAIDVGRELLEHTSEWLLRQR